MCGSLPGKEGRCGVVVADRGRCLVDDEVHPQRPQPCLHLPPRRVVEQLLRALEVGRGERFEIEPGSLHDRRLPHAGLARRVVEVDGQKQWFTADPRRVEPHSPAPHERSPILRARTEPGEAVWKRLEEGEHDRRRWIRGPRCEWNVHEPVELLSHPQHIAGSAGMRVERGGVALDAKMKGLERGDPVDDVGLGAHGMTVAGAAAPRHPKGITF